MKKLIVLIAALITLNGHADWRDDWAYAVEKCHAKKYEEAEVLFSKCIEEIEAFNEQGYPHVYVDRARLYLLLNKHQEALTDLNKAIENPNLSKKELTRALVSRICAKSNLGINDGISDDSLALNQSLPSHPEMEFTEKHIIIRNVPDCECFKNIISNFLLKNGFCKSISDIKMLESGIWIINRTEKCNCGCSKVKSPNQGSGCREWCDHIAIAGNAWCAKVF